MNPSTSPADKALQAEESVRAILGHQLEERNRLWSQLPKFNLANALLGHPYVHRFDIPWNRVCYNDIRQIAAPNPGYMIWAGEWLFMDYEELGVFFRMADVAVLGSLEMQTTKPILGLHEPSRPEPVPASEPAVSSAGVGWAAFAHTLFWSMVVVAVFVAGFYFGCGR